MPLEELSIIFSTKGLVHNNMLKQLDSKISNICKDQAGMDNKVRRERKRISLFSGQIDGDHVEEIVPTAGI